YVAFVLPYRSCVSQVTPACPHSFQNSLGTSSGPVALPFFVFIMAERTSSSVMLGTGPSTGSASRVDAYSWLADAIPSKCVLHLSLISCGFLSSLPCTSLIL
ncbi:unnamed protein product, partial [Cylicocyclus nassatus]